MSEIPDRRGAMRCGVVGGAIRNVLMVCMYGGEIRIKNQDQKKKKIRIRIKRNRSRSRSSIVQTTENPAEWSLASPPSFPFPLFASSQAIGEWRGWLIDVGVVPASREEIFFTMAMTSRWWSSGWLAGWLAG